MAVKRGPLSRKAKRKLQLAGGAVALLLVLVGGGAVAAGVLRANNGPEKVVKEFLTALVEGDAERAMAVAGPGIPSGSRVLMTNEIYAKTTTRPDGFTVLGTSVAGDVATVTVQLQQSRVKPQITYRLVKENPTLLNNNWTLQGTGAGKGLGTGAVVVQLDAKLSTIVVNGVEVSLAGLQPDGSIRRLPAFPGTYSLGLPATSTYLTAEPATAVVAVWGDGRERTAKLEPRRNAAFAAEVQEQVNTMLQACAGQKALTPEGCPFSVNEDLDARNVSWEITRAPTFTVFPRGDNSWSLSTEAAGRATASYERDVSIGGGGPAWEKAADESGIYLQGVVTLDQDELAVTFPAP